ncbi:DUF7529 family protein [Halomicrobium salinisoli]|uniref:DUF7529 family protein n=1 Tax=Halomicrobium salinisoli TaxID=2878391 RepID=UPI001CF0C33B|nr:hypothetical protein [Halomicrobium salinisoli]
MVETGDDGPDRADRIAAGADAAKSAWQATLEEAEALAERRRDEGREAVVVGAGDAGLATTDDGDVRLEFVVPGDDAETAERLVADHSLDRFDVYRRTVDGDVFIVVEYFEPDGPALLVAGAYELRNAGNAFGAAADDPGFYTRLQTLDRTPVAEFAHADRSKFVPEDVLPVEE